MSLRAALTGAMLLSGMAVPSRAQHNARDTIEVAVEDEADPWSRRDGTGYANDMVRAAFAAVHVPVKLLVMPYARCKQLAIEGAVVACVSMSANFQHPDPVDFAPRPLFVFSSQLLESVDHPLGTSRIDQLPRGTRVGVVLGYEYPREVYRLSRAGIVTLDYSGSETTNLRKLVAGRLDAAFINHNALKTLDYVMSSAGVAGRVRPLFSAGELPGHIGFSRKHPDAGWALKNYREGADRIDRDGSARRIAHSWAVRVSAAHAAELAAPPPASPPATHP